MTPIEADLGGGASRRLDGVVTPMVRALIRSVPPKGRGIRLAHGWTSLRPPDDSLFISREPSGMRLRCDLRDDISRIVYYRGWVDQGLHRWLAAWLRRGDVYVDVGAHIGSFVSEAASAVGANGRIIAFEPSPVTHAWLCQAVTDSGLSNIEVRTEAVGARKGKAPWHEPTHLWSAQSYRASVVDAPDLEPSGSVAVVALDDVIPDGRVRLLKIDVEGYEPSVLKGARQLLSDQRCDAVLMELNPPALARAGSTVEELVAVMGGHHYRPHHYSPEGAVHPWLEVAVRDQFPDAFADAIFLPDDG